jgi:hypothetical protein
VDELVEKEEGVREANLCDIARAGVHGADDKAPLSKHRPWFGLPKGLPDGGRGRHPPVENRRFRTPREPRP